jgi:hypothetical protein
MTPNLSDDQRLYQKRPFELTVGRLVMNFGALEASVLFGISELVLYSPSVTPNDEVPNTFGRSLKLFDRMVRVTIRDRAFLAAHKRLMDEIIWLKDKRNDFVHGPWLDMPGTNIDKVKGKLLKTNVPLRTLTNELRTARGVTPPEIAQISDAVGAMVKRFESHRGKIRSLLKMK